MTRKRFVKLMMANGHPRNEANEIARRVKRGVSYEDAFASIEDTGITPTLIDAVCGIVDAFGVLFEDLVDGICQLGTAFKNLGAGGDYDELDTE